MLSDSWASQFEGGRVEARRGEGKGNEKRELTFASFPSQKSCSNCSLDETCTERQRRGDEDSKKSYETLPRTARVEESASLTMRRRISQGKRRRNGTTGCRGGEKVPKSGSQIARSEGDAEKNLWHVGTDRGGAVQKRTGGGKEEGRR